ncbi:MAG: biotin/lipoyl-binding protein [Planctomycetota bacterium]
MSSRSRVLTWGLPLLGIAALAMGTGLVIENRPVRPQETPPRPPTSPPTDTATDEAQQYIGAIGTSEPPGEPIAIAAHISGVVTNVYVRVGDDVAEGDALFSVEDSRAAAEVAVRETEVAVALSEQASLAATIPPARAKVRSAEASLASAIADARAAEADAEDRRNLLRIATAVADPRAIAAEEVDRRRFAVSQAEAKLATAQAAVEQARAAVAESTAELSRLVDPTTSEDGPDLLAAAARTERARTLLTRAEADLALLTVSSPAEGRVLQVNIRPGEFAPASVPTEGLLVLGRTGSPHIRVQIDEVDIPRFSPNARAWASPRGDATRRMPLTRIAVEPLVIPKRSLAGRTSELVDTRVLEVVYAVQDDFRSPGVGQQFDVFIEAAGATP